jgi:hypothetical protein
MAAGNADSNRLGPLSRFKFSAKYHNDAVVFAFNESGICAEMPTSKRAIISARDPAFSVKLAAMQLSLLIKQRPVRALLTCLSDLRFQSREAR